MYVRDMFLHESFRKSFLNHPKVASIKFFHHITKIIVFAQLSLTLFDRNEMLNNIKKWQFSLSEVGQDIP